MIKLILISGQAGSGVTTMAYAYTDVGYRLMENVPNEILPDLLKVMVEKPESFGKSILKVDIRHAKTAISIIEKNPEIELTVVLLACSLDVIRARYMHSRNRHPLEAKGVAFEEAIKDDADWVKQIKPLSDLYIDTTALSDIELKKIASMNLEESENEKMVVTFSSFGFKYGELPTDAKVIFDARCLPNPFWDPKIRKFTGLEQPVIEWLDSKVEVQTFYEKMADFLDFYLSESDKVGRNYIFVYVGCTGGQHRSVYFVEKLFERYKDTYACFKSHREIKRYLREE